MMAHSTLPKSELPPGISGLFDFPPEAEAPLRLLAETLLSGKSLLASGEWQLIAAVVSCNNDSTSYANIHNDAADLLLQESEAIAMVKYNISLAPVSDKMKSLLKIAKQVKTNGKAVTNEAIAEAKDRGATDLEIHDAVLTAAIFCLFNRFIDGITSARPTAPGYARPGEHIVKQGFNHFTPGYGHWGN